MSKEKNIGKGFRRMVERDPMRERDDLRRTRPVPLPYGVASAVLRNGLLQSVEWERSLRELEASLSKKFPEAQGIGPEECEAGRLLLAYSEGRKVTSEDVASIRVDWDLAGRFQRIVLKTLVEVPYGKTITYGGLAERIGRGEAARAVGGALAKNPWPVVVPCHRVVGAGGKMVGFGKGVEAKRRLLRFEERNLSRPAKSR